MDGKGRFLDNIFIERLWRSLKYEEVFIKAYGSVAEARRGIGAWLSVLQRRAQASGAGLSDAARNFRGAACGYVDNARRVAHIPTGATTTAKKKIPIKKRKGVPSTPNACWLPNQRIPNPCGTSGNSGQFLSS